MKLSLSVADYFEITFYVRKVNKKDENYVTSDCDKTWKNYYCQTLISLCAGNKNFH
jgi:hypothetical protein